jgi:hypothetical protein
MENEPIKLGKNQDSIVGVKIILIMENTDDLELELDHDTQKVIFSCIYNMFKGDLKFKD